MKRIIIIMLLVILNACSKSDVEPYDPYYDPEYEFNYVRFNYRSYTGEEYEAWCVWHEPNGSDTEYAGTVQTINGVLKGWGISIKKDSDCRPLKSVDGTWARYGSYKGNNIPHYELVAKLKFRCPVCDNAGYITGMSSDWKYAYGQYEEYERDTYSHPKPTVFRIFELYDEIPE